MRKDGSSLLRPAGAGPERATFLELFFDLVFVFALTRIVFRSFEDLALEPGGSAGWRAVTGGGKTLLLLLAFWSIWQGTAWTTNRYDPYQIWLQAIVIIALVCTMVMSTTAVQTFRDVEGLAFAVAYVVAQVSRALLLLIALRHDRRRRWLKLRMLFHYSATGVLWIVGAVVSTNFRITIWALALGLEYVAARTGWVAPWFGRSTTRAWDIAGAHLAERYQQFFLVALGETILVIGFTFSSVKTTPASTVAFAVALATTVLIWRIYIQRAGQVLAEAVETAREPATIGRSASDTHLIMVIGVVATAVGYRIVITHPLGDPEPAWVVMVLGGPAVFLASRARFEYEVFGRVSRSRVLAIVALAALVYPMLMLPALAPLVAGAAVLLTVAALDAKRAWGVPPERAATPY